MAYDDYKNKWSSYWDLLPDGPPTLLEQGAEWTSASEAVTWGRARTPRVLIRLKGEGEYRWAGAGDPPYEKPLRKFIMISS